MKIVITGGHHTSALPVISELQKRVSDVEIFWIGHKHSIRSDKNPTLEFREITGLGIKFFDLKAGKLYKTFNIIRLLRVPYGVIQAFFYLAKIRPNVIASFGGYLAAPVVLAGWFLGIPAVTHEQTVVVGYANRFISMFTKKTLLTWEKSKQYFRNKPTSVVGLPLRPEIFKSLSTNFHQNSDLPTVYITAGKTGSHIINELVLGTLGPLLTVCNVIHQCGDTSIYDDYQRLKDKFDSLNVPGEYNLRKFIFGGEIGEAYSKANLVVGRSGAHTIYELLALEKPAILIPIAWVSHNEQTANAHILQDAGLARLLEEKDLTPNSFQVAVVAALRNLNNMKLTDSSIKNSLVSNSSELIVDELLASADEKSK